MKDIVVGVKINKQGAVTGVKDIDRELGKIETSGKKASKGIGSFTESLKKNKVALLASAAGIGVLLGKLAKDSIRLATIQIEAEAKLAATIKATGSAAGLTANQLKAMASGLQSVTTVGDEAIIGAQALLLTFKNIGGDIFPRVTEAVLDMSQAMGVGLKEASIQLGKALNDPVLGVSALTRVGIQFTQVQKDEIKQFVELNDLASAQAVILKEVEGQFGGVARALAETDVGKIQQMNNELGDVQELIGMKLIPAQLWWNEALLESIQFWGQLSVKALSFLGIDNTTLTKMERYNSLIDGARDRIEIWGDAIKDAEAEKSNFVYIGDEEAISIKQAKEELAGFNVELKEAGEAYDKIAGTNIFTKAAGGVTKKGGTSTKKTASKFTPNLQSGASQNVDPNGFLGMPDFTTYKAALDKNVEALDAANAEIADAYIASEQLKYDAAKEIRDQEIADAETRKQQLIDGAFAMGQQLMNIANAFQNKASNREKKAISEYEKQEKSKISTLNVSNKRKAQLQAELDKKLDAKKKEQFEKDKRYSIAMAIINGALGVAAAMTQPSNAMKIIGAALAVASSIAAVTAISSQQFAEGGIVRNTRGAGVDREPAMLTAGEIVSNSRQQDNLMRAMETGVNPLTNNTNNTTSSNQNINFNVVNNVGGEISSESLANLQEANDVSLENLENRLSELKTYGRLEIA